MSTATPSIPAAPARPLIWGWSFVARNSRVFLAHTTAGTRDGELLVSLWRTGMSATSFAASYGNDRLPIALTYEGGGVYREAQLSDLGRYQEWRVGDGSERSDAVYVIPVTLPALKAGQSARWSSLYGLWEVGPYRTKPAWRSAPRVLGEERPA